MSLDAARIEALVREVVTRTLGQGRTAAASRPILDEAAVRQMPVGSVQSIAANTLVTPLARQVALERKIQLTTAAETAVSYPNQTAGSRIAIGADHGGFALKEILCQFLEADHTVVDCGTFSKASVDYPDYAYAVAQKVAQGQADWGIIVDGAGIGSCMTANKVPGVRAAMCYDQATAVNSREHNHANVLTLGAGLIGVNLAKQIVSAWLATDFGGGRHARRVGKIDQLDKRFRS